ncbi:MAG: diguanylate cyclase protein [Firmicutes bacterium]|nr:diguanylate cyclase protein [Bacillota bacterium]
MTNILVIDDSPIDRKMIKLALTSKLAEINLIEKDSVDNIHEILDTYQIDVCILDIMMPEKNGLDVLKDIKDNERYRDMPVIVCTGLDDIEIIEKSLMLGAYDCFFKPLGKKEITISLPLKVKNAIDLKKRNDEILYLSYHDNLTGLFNRRYLDEEIIKLQSQKHLSISIIIGDVDGLKVTNDVYGHEEGDQLLKTIAQILREECRSGLVARKGGDEFIVLFPDTDISIVRSIVQAIKDNCDRRNESPVKPSISLGYAMTYMNDQDINHVIKEAEDMMYLVKLGTGHSRM